MTFEAKLEAKMKEDKNFANLMRYLNDQRLLLTYDDIRASKYSGIRANLFIRIPIERTFLDYYKNLKYFFDWNGDIIDWNIIKSKVIDQLDFPISGKEWIDFDNAFFHCWNRVNRNYGRIYQGFIEENVYNFYVVNKIAVDFSKIKRIVSIILHEIEMDNEYSQNPNLKGEKRSDDMDVFECAWDVNSLSGRYGLFQYYNDLKRVGYSEDEVITSVKISKEKLNGIKFEFEQYQNDQITNQL